MNFTKKVLDNGLRIITVPMKDNPTVTVLCMVEAGSKYEVKRTSGISHFLEHLCFKGTTKRRKSIDIARELDSLGAQYNAFTSQEFTGYYAKSDAKHFDTVLDVVSDVYQNSLFPAEEIEKEKGVICEEINMYQDLPQKHVQDVFLELLYGDTPAGWNVAGSKDSVNSFTRPDFLKYHEERYISGATVVVIAGNINEEKAVAKVIEQFSTIRSGINNGKLKVEEKQTEPAMRIEYKETDQTHIVVGVRSFDTYSVCNPALRIISALLGGGMSSRLFQKIRGEMGAAYYVGAGNDSFTDHGFFEIVAGVDSKKIVEVTSAILSEMARLKNEPVSEQELRKAKDYVEGNLYLGLESSDELAEFYGYQEVLRKNVRLPKEVAKETQMVTAEEVLKVSNEIFNTDHLNMAVIGRYREEEMFRKILKL